MANRFRSMTSNHTNMATNIRVETNPGKCGSIRFTTSATTTAEMAAMNAASPVFPYRTSALHPTQTEAPYNTLLRQCGQVILLTPSRG